MLAIKDLYASIEEKDILKGLNLEIQPGEVHAIMGPNGAGKSTLAKTLAGHPDIEIKQGSIVFQGEAIEELEPEERVHKGLFMSFQYPMEIAGISNFDLLYAAKSSLSRAQGKQVDSEKTFKLELMNLMTQLKISPEFLDRDVNCGFSGGEKKRNEILQMAVLNPALAILDETDSGLDIDAMKIVAEGVNRQRDEKKAILLITHYQRLLNYIKPDVIHVMVDGKIIKSGDASLALELEEKGYDWLLEPQRGAVC